MTGTQAARLQAFAKTLTVVVKIQVKNNQRIFICFHRCASEPLAFQSNKSVTKNQLFIVLEKIYSSV
jgi:hypothetical protein